MRNYQHPNDIHSIDNFTLALKQSVSRESLSLRIVKDASDDRHLMSSLCKMKSHIIHPKHFRIEVISVDKDTFWCHGRRNGARVD